jgi:hypothetical protein
LYEALLWRLTGWPEKVLSRRKNIMFCKILSLKTVQLRTHDKIILLQDGRLRVNDQLVEVNGMSLVGLDNTRALHILREAMQKDGRIRGFIGITVARPKNSQVVPQPVVVSPREVRVSQHGETDENNHTVDQSMEKSSGDKATATCKAVAVSETVPASAKDTLRRQLSQDIQRVSSDGLSLIEEVETASRRLSTETDVCSEVM